ncbi:MAG: hypothetical protein HC819_01515 [Cyclobacteriaceae bacterium]|nr:hypothetical protein [Cyclobacteriaceae bacterium]
MSNTKKAPQGSNLDELEQHENTKNDSKTVIVPIGSSLSEAAEELDEPADILDFFELDKKNSKWKVGNDRFIKCLVRLGYRTIELGKAYEFVKIENCIVERAAPTQVKQHILSLCDDSDKRDVIIGNTRLFSDKFLDAIKLEKLAMHRDTPTVSFFYYNNGVLKVSKDGWELIPYQQFKKLVWRDHISDRDFNPADYKLGQFYDFIKKVCANDAERIKGLMTTIGFALHDYKTSATSRAIIIQDEMFSDTPEGGSGKGLIVVAIGKLRKTINMDGKNFDAKNNFVWENVNESVRVIHIDDVRTGFNFEDLFSVITGGFQNVNRKNKAEFSLPVEDSPIIIITTNNVVRGASGSFLRRQIAVDLHQYFHSERTPHDQYGNFFFEEWSEAEWEMFDSFMIACVQLYFAEGVLPCKGEDDPVKRAVKATSQTFVEWFQDTELLSTEYSLSEARNQYKDHSDIRSSISGKRIGNYIRECAKIFGFEVKQISNRHPRTYTLVKTTKQSVLSVRDDEIPF